MDEKIIEARDCSPLKVSVKFGDNYKFEAEGPAWAVKRDAALFYDYIAPKTPPSNPTPRIWKPWAFLRSEPK